MRSVMKHSFSQVPNVDIPRSTFDRSRGRKFDFDAGYLVPFFIDEVLPGDTYQVSADGFARLSTPTFPILDNMILDTFFFFVPNRLVWSNWPKFCGEQVDPGDSIDYTVPVIDDFYNVSNLTLGDYFGLPTKVNTLEVNSLLFRSYNLIYREWFRDQNLIDSPVVDIDDGPDAIADYVLLRRCKKHDYFTSALPWLQKGDAVSLSLGTSAPVVSEGSGIPTMTIGATTASFTGDSSDTIVDWSTTPNTSTYAVWEDTALETDLSSATASTVNELRQAIQVQRMLERDARSGTRYIEIIKSYFGVISDDARLQRPEYLGGGSSPVMINPVARTDSAPGDLGAYGVIGFNNHGFIKSFSEHGHIIGLVNVRADITYQEGLERMWTRQTRYDFYWPTLAHLGEQSILNQEIFCDGSANDTDVFGYQERFAEYRYANSRVCGKMRSNATGTLDPWHLSIEFGSLPTLDDTFIVDDPPIDRIIETPTESHFKFDCFVKVRNTRPMPVYSVPGLIDHF